MRKKEYWYKDPEENSNYLWIKIFLAVSLISATCWGLSSVMLREYSPDSIIDSTYYDLCRINTLSIIAAVGSTLLLLALIIYEHHRANRMPKDPTIL